MGAIYLDSSALVKLVVREAESTALRHWLRDRGPYVSSALASVEVTRAVRHVGPGAIDRASALLDRVRLLALDDTVLRSARDLDPTVLRSLDAIHLASALAFGSDLEVLVAYDRRLLDAADILRLPTASPGQ